MKNRNAIYALHVVLQNIVSPTNISHVYKTAEMAAADRTIFFIIKKIYGGTNLDGL